MPAELIQLRAALRGNEEDTRRFIMAREGMIPPNEFFNAENLDRVLINAEVRPLVPARHEYTGEAQNY